MEATCKSNAEEVYLTLSNGNKQRISRMKLIVRTTSYSIIESITKKYRLLCHFGLQMNEHRFHPQNQQLKVYMYVL